MSKTKNRAPKVVDENAPPKEPRKRREKTQAEHDASTLAKGKGLIAEIDAKLGKLAAAIADLQAKREGATAALVEARQRLLAE